MIDDLIQLIFQFSDGSQEALFEIYYIISQKTGKSLEESKQIFEKTLDLISEMYKIDDERISGLPMREVYKKVFEEVL